MVGKKIRWGLYTDSLRIIGFDREGAMYLSLLVHNFPVDYRVYTSRIVKCTREGRLLKSVDILYPVADVCHEDPELFEDFQIAAPDILVSCDKRCRRMRIVKFSLP